jgi:hypothetical protein
MCWTAVVAVRALVLCVLARPHTGDAQPAKKVPRVGVLFPAVLSPADRLGARLEALG